jgi:hypothetical protein
MYAVFLSVRRRPLAGLPRASAEPPRPSRGISSSTLPSGIQPSSAPFPGAGKHATVLPSPDGLDQLRDDEAWLKLEAVPPPAPHSAGKASVDEGLHSSNSNSNSEWLARVGEALRELVEVRVLCVCTLRLRL